MGLHFSAALIVSGVHAMSRRVRDLTQRLEGHKIEHQHRYRRSRKSSTGCGGLRALYMLMVSAIWLTLGHNQGVTGTGSLWVVPVCCGQFHTSALPAWEKNSPLENRWLANNLNSWAYDDRCIKRQVWEIKEASLGLRCYISIVQLAERQALTLLIAVRVRVLMLTWENSIKELKSPFLAFF